MRRTRIKLEADIQLLPEPKNPLVKMAIKDAIRTAVLFAKALWLQRAQDLGIRRTGTYLDGIQQAQILTVNDLENGGTLQLDYDIVCTAPHARIIEDGHPAFSLAQAINWGSNTGRIKRGKNGPYLHIAFRHAAFQDAKERKRSGMTVGALKTMMPAEVYHQAAQLRPTIPKRQGPQYKLTHGGSATQFLAADRYHAGERYHDPTSGPRFVGGAGGTVDAWRGERTVQGRTKRGERLTNPAWQSARYQGLFRSQTAVGTSQYLTIRTISPNSAGWNIPARQGLGVARQVAQALNSGVGSERFQQLLVSAIRQRLGFAS